MADTTIRPPSAQFLKDGTDINVTVRARKALAAFNRLRPQLSAFARVMTGNATVQILPTGGAPATDGKVIYIKPNLGLGDHRRHPDPRKCHDKRDPATGLLVCEACRESEEILVSLFHEIGHIVYDSFESMDDYEKGLAVERAVEEATSAGVPAKIIDKVKRSFAQSPPSNYIEAAARISPFMPMLLNALEDARVNDLTIKARPGMKVMFEASEARIFEGGVEQLDGSVTKWSEAPMNAQALIGTFIVASGTDLKPGWLSDEVFEAMHDDELQELLTKVRESESVRGVYRVAFPILERLRQLGFCQFDDPEDEDDSVEGDATPDQEDTGGDDDDQGDPSPGPSSGDPFDIGEEEDDDADDAESEDEGAADAEASDEGESGDAGMSAEQEGDDDAESEGGPSDEADNENGQGGTWDSQERDDLGEDEDGTGSATDDTDDDTESDTDADDTDPTTGDEDGAHDDESDDGDTDPGTESGDDTGDRGASGDDDTDAGEGDGEEGDDQAVQENDPYGAMGTPDQVGALLTEFGGHEHDDEEPDKAEEEAIDRAIEQDEHFDDPSDIVTGVNIHEYGKRTGDAFALDPERGKAMVPIDERNIQNAVIPMRKAFAANKMGGKQPNLRSGKINARSLAKRVPVNDDRMFLKRRRPAKRDYHVVIGLDISGSTGHLRLNRIKAAAFMQAELCNRVGVPFEVWAHTGDFDMTGELPSGVTHGYGAIPYPVTLEMYKIKGLDEPWNVHTQARLWSLKAHQVNLDGHTLEFYRKRLDASHATDNLLIYYTDGEMPNFNYNEEVVILKRELKEFRQRNYAILGVGIDTTSPTRHGLDTVAVYSDEDIRKVVMELEKRLA